MDTTTSTPADAATAALARFVAGLTYERLNKKVIDCARERIIDQLGVQLLGSTLPLSNIVIDHMRHYGGLEESSIVGCNLCVPSFDAAFANATFGHSCELDDYGGGAHSGVSTIPATLALAEANKCSGAAVICAIVAGFEVIHCLCNLLHAGLGKRGFHGLGVLGVFGAAAAAANLLKLNEEQTLHALAIAGSYAGKTMEYDQSGGEVKRIHAGLVAQGGVQAALFAQRGLTGPVSILEGHRGIARVFADYDGDWSAQLDQLGREFAITHVNTKIHPVLGRVQSSLDAAAALTGSGPIPAKDIVSIDVGVHAGTLKHGGSIRKPKDTLSAQMSLPFALAMHLVTGHSELADFMDPDMRSNPDILSVAEKVTLHVDPEATGKRYFSCDLRLRLASGRELQTVQIYPKGSSANPVTHDELLAKFRRLAGAALADAQIDDVIRTLDYIETMQDVSALMRALSADRR